MKLELKANFREEIKTERLIITPWKTEFAQQMFDNWATDKEVNKFLSWELHKNVEETTQLILNWMGECNYNWCIVDKASGEAVGSISVVRRNDREFNCEIGYCLSRKLWNKGYMTEALKAVINFLFSEGYVKINLKHAIKNPASGKVMQKAGMTFEGISPCSSNVRGTFYDCNVYYILNPNIKVDRA